MTGVIYNCPNLFECLENSTLSRTEAFRLYFLNQGGNPEDIKINDEPLQFSQNFPSRIPLYRPRFNYNTDYELRDAIVFGTSVRWEESSGGAKYFERLKLEQLQQLIAQRFANPEACNNNSPTISEFVEFAQTQANKGFEFTFEGYAISPFRTDYRVSIDGIALSGNYSSELLADFHRFVGEPDELNVHSQYLRAWWD